jgi:hypothetical protein
VKVTANFPEPCRFVLETFREIYGYDAVARKQSMSAEQRLAFHQEHSKPVMEKLHVWLNTQLDERLVEPNSGLRQAISYLLNHWQKLTLFLEKPGVPLDNNIVERALKKAILHRKNSLFYKTRKGAEMGDLYMRTQRHQCLRLPDGTAAARGGIEKEPVGVDAVELSGYPYPAGGVRSRVIKSMITSSHRLLTRAARKFFLHSSKQKTA